MHCDYPNFHDTLPFLYRRFAIFDFFSVPAHNVVEGSRVVVRCSLNRLGEFYLHFTSTRNEIVNGYIFANLFNCKQGGCQKL